MFSRPRNALIFALALALVVGYFVAGYWLYRLPIGLDAPGIPIALGLSLMTIGAVAFWLVRRAVASGVDPERRRFLTGAGSGASVALGSVLLGGGAAAARALLGVGTGTKGWMVVGAQINDRELPFTHPQWKEGWKGSRVQC